MSGRRAKQLRREANQMNYAQFVGYYEKNNRTGSIRLIGAHALYKRFKKIYKEQRRGF